MDVDDMDFPLPQVEQQQPQQGGGVRIGQSLGGMKVVNDPSQFKSWICLYPLYFDNARSVEQGRKVPLSLAVESPHDRQLSMATKEAGFNVCYEPNKSHPRDFFTAGRVRVKLFDEQGRPMRGDVVNRKQLMKQVAEKMGQVNAPREKEPTLQDLIESGAMPALPGMPPMGGADNEPSPASAASTSTKASKKSKKKGKGKAKNLV